MNRSINRDSVSNDPGSDGLVTLRMKGLDTLDWHDNELHHHITSLM